MRFGKKRNQKNYGQTQTEEALVKLGMIKNVLEKKKECGKKVVEGGEGG